MTIAASEHSVSFWPLTSRDRGQLVAALWVGLLLVVRGQRRLHAHPVGGEDR